MLKREILCHKVTHKNSKRRLFVFILKKISHIKASLLSMAYPNPAFVKWCSKFSKQCQIKAISNLDIKNEADLMKENFHLRKEFEESKK